MGTPRPTLNARRLDSNIVFCALISQHGPPHGIYQGCRQGRFDLVTALVQRQEIRRAIVLDALAASQEASDPDASWLLGARRKRRRRIFGDRRQAFWPAGTRSRRQGAHSHGGRILRNPRLISMA